MKRFMWEINHIDDSVRSQKINPNPPPGKISLDNLSPSSEDIDERYYNLPDEADAPHIKGE